MGRIILLVCLFLFACGPDRERLSHTIRIDSDFSDIQTELIIKSIDDWKEATSYTFLADAEVGPVEEFDEYSIFYVRGLINNKTETLGRTENHDEFGRILIRSDLGESFIFENVVKHELGHYLLIEHYHQVGDLMYYLVNKKEPMRIESHHIEEFNYIWN